MHRLIKQTSLPNYLGARIPVLSQRRPDRWRFHLKQFWDKQIVDLIQYGFPLDFDRTCQLQSTEINHTSALQNLDHIESYITEQCAFNAMNGPFKEPPIELHISPSMTRSKQNSNKRRTIMDPSWPKVFSVNDGVKRDQYLGSYFTLHYPSLDHITDALKHLGSQALVYKIDISRTFRLLTIDPRDIDLLGSKHHNYFIDGSLPFGF